MSNHHRRMAKASNSLQDECIRVPKVYDWVTDTLTVSKNVSFTEEQLEAIECAMEDPRRRPLRIICQTPVTPPLFPISQSDSMLVEKSGFFCEQIGDKKNVTVPLNGEFVDAQLVDLLFTAEVRIEVVDRQGEVVTSLKTDVNAVESFVLCFPDGTDLLCRVSKIFCKLSTGTLMLNSPSPGRIKVEVTFCVDVQIEAEVKLEILAKFCSPRENNIEAPISVDQCPPITFPQQCPDIFPKKGCDCSAEGEASGRTSEECTESGRAGILVNICPNCSLIDSVFDFTFDDREAEDGLKDFSFFAQNFDEESLRCKPCDGGVKLLISGDGKTDKGKRLDFNLAIVNSSHGDQFQVQLINERTGHTFFDTGIVDVDEGTLSIEDCVNHRDDMKVKH